MALVPVLPEVADASAPDLVLVMGPSRGYLRNVSKWPIAVTYRVTVVTPEGNPVEALVRFTYPPGQTAYYYHAYGGAARRAVKVTWADHRGPGGPGPVVSIETIT